MNPEYPYGDHAYVEIWNAIQMGTPVPFAHESSPINLQITGVGPFQPGQGFMVEGIIVTPDHPECGSMINMKSMPVADQNLRVPFARI